MTTADQCRAMGLTVGDKIVGRETHSSGWSESELTVLFIGLEVVVFSERQRDSNCARWWSEGESADWTLECREWKKV